MPRWSCLLLLFAPGCLSIADFPDEALIDASVPDRTPVDAARDTADTLAPDTLPPDTLSPDTRPWCASGSCDNPTPVCELKDGLCRKCFDHAECVKEGKGAICDQSAGNTCRPCKDAADCQSEGLPPLCSPDGRCTISCTTDQDCQSAGQGDHCDTVQKTCEFCQTDAECQTWGPMKWLVCDKTGTSAKCRGCGSHAECQSLNKGLFCDAGGTCRNSCQSDAECIAAGQEPFCDTVTKTCRGCITHVECGPQGYCELGACKKATSGVSYVKCTKTCSGGGTGTAQSPFCRLDEADTASPKTVAVIKGDPCPGHVFKFPKNLYGEPGATIAPAACEALKFDKVDGLLSGFTIEGNVHIKDATGTLIGNTIGPNKDPACSGVTTEGASVKVILERNLIWKHPGGGLDIDGSFTIVNNFIVKNGDKGLDWGAAKLKGSGTFAHNTVSENVSKADANNKVAVRCENPMNLVSSIFWGNLPHGSFSNPLDPDCKPRFSDVEGLSPLTNNNIALNPKFKGGAGPGADPWHLQPGSPCEGKADPSKPPAMDFDGEPRSKTAPDIGADEIL